DPLQHDDRDLSRRLLLVLGEGGHHRGLVPVEAVALPAFGGSGAGVERLTQYLQRDEGGGGQVVLPARGCWGTGLGGDDDVVFPAPGVDQGSLAMLARPRARCAQDHQWPAGERARGSLTGVGTEIGNQVLVEPLESAAAVVAHS